MKPIHLLLSRRLVISKRFYFSLLVIGGLASITVVQTMRSANSSTNFGSALLGIYYGIIRANWITVLIIPLFLLLIGLISDVFDNYKVLLKYRSAKQWWREKIGGMSLFAVIYMLVINLYILGAIIVSGHVRDINLAFLGFLLLGMVMQLVGFLVIGVFYQLTVLISEHQYIGLFIIVLLLILVDIFKFICKSKFTTLQEYMSLAYKWNSGKNTWVTADFLPILCLVSIFIVLYLVGSTLSQDKDFYWSE